MSQSFLNLQPTRLHPIFWVRRLVILERLDPFTVIRDIPLQRGLNIIYGEEKATSSSITAFGHGVGKTSFCRLIRYCLGEKHFGKSRVVAEIRREFPSGWVGAEVMIEAQLWSVLRPFYVGAAPRASIGVTVEALAPQKQQTVPYATFEQTLADAVMSKMPSRGQIVPGTEITLGHVLPMFTRDQECRLESIWKWRSERSDSESPAFGRPKVDGSRMIRAVLGLLNDSEVTLQGDVDQTRDKLDKVRRQIEDRLKEPQYWIDRNRRLLVTEGVRATSASDSGLFSAENMTDAKLRELRNELRSCKDQADAAFNERDELTAKLTTAREQHRQLKAELALQAMRGKQASELSDEDRRLIDELKSKQNGIQRCLYGGVPFSECTHVAKYLETLGTRKKGTALPVVANADQRAAAIEKELSEIESSIRQLEERKVKVARLWQESSDKASSIERQIDRIQSASNDLAHYDGIVQGTVQDSRLSDLRRQQSVLESALSQQSRGLSSERGKMDAQARAIESVYTAVVKAAVSGEFIGEISLTDDEIQFGIRRNAAVGGEAVESLTVVLADLCALLASMEGRSNHPGFLLHDSPREADLGAGLYAQVLRLMYQAHQAFGANERSPFQYIVTTTTPPPAELRDLQRAVLSDERDDMLLFCRRLGAGSFELGDPDASPDSNTIE
jgi:hypothetical protein